MSEAKLEIEIGCVRFSGEGSEEWLGLQFDKILSNLETLNRIPGQDNSEDTPEGGESDSGANTIKQNLPSFLDSMNAKSVQVRKFLATAAWLHRVKSSQRITTKDISNALRESNQTKINNPSDTLNQNVTKGFCEKVGDQFFVTNEGFAELKL